MTVTLSDNEESDHESDSVQEDNFMAFTTTAVVDEFVVVDERPSDGEPILSFHMNNGFYNEFKVKMQIAPINLIEIHFQTFSFTFIQLSSLNFKFIQSSLQ